MYELARIKHECADDETRRYMMDSICGQRYKRSQAISRGNNSDDQKLDHEQLGGAINTQSIVSNHISYTWAERSNQGENLRHKLTTAHKVADTYHMSFSNIMWPTRRSMDRKQSCACWGGKQLSYLAIDRKVEHEVVAQGSDTKNQIGLHGEHVNLIDTCTRQIRQQLYLAVVMHTQLRAILVVQTN